MKSVWVVEHLYWINLSRFWKLNRGGAAQLHNGEDHLLNSTKSCLDYGVHYNYQKALSFLKAYRGSRGTFDSYRREIERFLQWSWTIANKTIKELKRGDIESFIDFCQEPPKSWIGLKKTTRFIEKEGRRIQNPKWRPFIATISKVSRRKGETPNVKDFEFSEGAVKETFAILSSFYNYLLQEE